MIQSYVNSHLLLLATAMCTKANTEPTRGMEAAPSHMPMETCIGALNCVSQFPTPLLIIHVTPLYSGEWKNGYLDGFGTYTYSDGDVYGLTLSLHALARAHHVHACRG